MLFGSFYPRPDLLVSDIRMTGFTGLEVLAGLRDLTWRIPTLLMTAYGDDATHAQARSLGARAVFTKPFDLDDLRTVVLNLLPHTSWRPYGPFGWKAKGDA